MKEFNLENWGKPITRENIRVDGLAAETIEANQKGTFIRKSFITSFESCFDKLCNNIFSLLLPSAGNNRADNLLAIIKPDYKASIYIDNFPFGFKARLKKSKEKYTVVFQNEIFDLEAISFSDAKFTPNIADGDKIIWLFRHNWRFGLFFDFSGSLREAEIYKELGHYYKRMIYLDVYNLLEKGAEKIISDGWFPFIQLIGGEIQKLIDYYEQGQKYKFLINNILNSYDTNKVKEISNNWWEDKRFQEKRDIIEAGIEAYFMNTKSGYITSIKTLATEIEGIMRFAYLHDNGRKANNTEELKQYVKKLGAAKYSSQGSLGFPGLFYEYLTKSIFQRFDEEDGNINVGRHSIAHGITKTDQYTRERAFQLILTLDQLYFFLS